MQGRPVMGTGLVDGLLRAGHCRHADLGSAWRLGLLGAILGWFIGLGAVILLWQRSSSSYFRATAHYRSG
jgi:hypothetical protein